MKPSEGIPDTRDKNFLSSEIEANTPSAKEEYDYDFFQSRPPPMPWMESKKQPDIQTVVEDVIKRMTINGQSPQISGGAIEFNLPFPKSEQPISYNLSEVNRPATLQDTLPAHAYFPPPPLPYNHPSTLPEIPFQPSQAPTSTTELKVQTLPENVTSPNFTINTVSAAQPVNITNTVENHNTSHTTNTTSEASLTPQIPILATVISSPELPQTPPSLPSGGDLVAQTPEVVSGGVVVEKEREVVVSGVVGEVRVESPGFVEGMRFDKPEKVDGYEPKVNEAEIASVKFIAKLPKNDYYVEHAPFSMVGQSSSAWGLTGGFIDETLGGYRHEFLETAMSGSKLWLEIVQDGSCGVVSVIFKSGTSFPAVKVLDTGGTFAETLNVPWAEWDGGVVNQFRSGNCVLTIWDIDGYACRWPEMIGGRPCLA